MFKLKRQGLWGEAGDQISWEPVEEWESQRHLWAQGGHSILPAASGNRRDGPRPHLGQGSHGGRPFIL